MGDVSRAWRQARGRAVGREPAGPAVRAVIFERISAQVVMTTVALGSLLVLAITIDDWSLLAFMVDRLGPAAYDTPATSDLLTYLAAGGPWTGSSTQVRTKTAGLAHLIGGSAECQFV